MEEPTTVAGVLIYIDEHRKVFGFPPAAISFSEELEASINSWLETMGPLIRMKSRVIPEGICGVPIIRSEDMAKKTAKGELPVVDEKGFFQTPHDMVLGGKPISAGSWLKVLWASDTNKTWLVRPRYHKDSTAVKVQSRVFAKQ